MEPSEGTFSGMERAEQWLGTPAASSYLGIGLRKMYRLIDQGDIPAYQMGRVLRIKQQDLDAYLEQARVEPGSLRHLRPRGLRGSRCLEEDEPQ